ncbi:aspartic proteinase-like protein 1 isoform X1 [Chenopodium quinoa]|uniref:aspartic proteinase-like protein 1 isoform X1 n=1 Tax=Chenopodium quinoa TaxID=63459 RepID=UPI000B7747C3|nr:aspartic proteinase-like protein 1 isoform X1 [Chenopodium quinoa]
MAKKLALLLWMLLILIMIRESSMMYTSRLVHRFSDELRGFSGKKLWPEFKSKEYYQRLSIGDFQRQKMKIGHQHQLVFPSQGSQAQSFGNELGWLYYAWIDIGTPNVSFMVALDAGSDLLWVPCDCVQCASLSATHYDGLDKNLNEYNPDSSNSSKLLTCSHRLCAQQENCKSPTQSCPYNVQYFSENTSSSGQLVEDVLHLSSSSNSPSSIKASIIFGCGKKQSGVYLEEGIAPDGLMGLGPGDISVPSLLAKSGLIRNTFSLCFNENFSGRIYFGDQGLNTHQWTPFLPLDGKYSTYVVGVDSVCIGKGTCLKQTSFHAVVDSGFSFTYLPDDVYKKVTQEFDKEVEAARVNYDGSPWDYCYKSSGDDLHNYPSLELMLPSNQSFVVQYPMYTVNGYQGIVGYCLAVGRADGDIAIIGQNFMTGYRMVFDRENMKLGWSHSDCQDLSNQNRKPSMPPAGDKPPNALPSNEQQSIPGAQAVSPAIAGRTSPKASAASAMHPPFSSWILLSVLATSFVTFHLQWYFKSVFFLDLM